MLYATGKSGTIGRHLSANVGDILMNLVEPISEDTLPRASSSYNLLHLAGVVGTAKVNVDAMYSHEVNIKGTLRLAEAFSRKSKGKFIFASTSHVYKTSMSKISEDSELNPLTLYAEQKLEAELSLARIFENDPTRLCVVRVFSVLDWDVEPFTLGAGIQKLANKHSSYVLHNSDDVRDFLTPRKIASTMEQISSRPEIFGIVNLCSGTGLTVRSAAEIMLQSAGYEIPPERIMAGNSQNPIIVGDNQRLKTFLPNLELNWEPSPITLKWL